MKQNDYQYSLSQKQLFKTFQNTKPLSIKPDKLKLKTFHKFNFSLDKTTDNTEFNNSNNF